ncbi:MAG: glycoside hydrolase family 16 protein [Candidatus Marinimicrobia bacterium]|nr:glycoside hydrolase family 16 protein [Candidatus Neomarinimicrobiota bacterium]MCF7829552.1 glycoside hydrolase family 16 protein [Candidatus Neomarinimicrobiota bacterium]MCF7882002.1 glycoside hydrolase family 16 protein [Candidatus Neomarinimicrobiota bacterium]
MGNTQSSCQHWIVRAQSKILLFSVVIILAIGCSKNGVSAENDDTPNVELDNYELIWQDEFSEDFIDPRKWSHEVNGEGGGNNELQYYTDRTHNSYVDSGELHIVARRETYTGDDGTRYFTSARLRTMGKGDWKYGRFEIRAKLPQGQGLWPAIWMLPTDWVYGGWAASGEIDIMESLGHDPDRVYGTLHYGGQYPDNVHTGDSYTLTSGTFADSFHVFRMDWDSTEIRWYVDDEHYQTQTQWYSANGDYPAPFDKRFHLLLNVAVGGDWPGDPDESTNFPQEMVVDYVRVYKPLEE